MTLTHPTIGVRSITRCLLAVYGGEPFSYTAFTAGLEFTSTFTMATSTPNSHVSGSRSISSEYTHVNYSNFVCQGVVHKKYIVLFYRRVRRQCHPPTVGLLGACTIVLAYFEVLYIILFWIEIPSSKNILIVWFQHSHELPLWTWSLFPEWSAIRWRLFEAFKCLLSVDRESRELVEQKESKQI